MREVIAQGQIRLILPDSIDTIEHRMEYDVMGYDVVKPTKIEIELHAILEDVELNLGEKRGKIIIHRLHLTHLKGSLEPKLDDHYANRLWTIQIPVDNPQPNHIIE